MKGVRSVLHVVISLRAGGLERLVVDLANERNRRHPGSTAICCLDAPGELAPQAEGPVTCAALNRARKPLDWPGLLRLRRIMKSAQVIHTHNLAALQHATLAGWGLSPGRVHAEHGTNPHVRGWKNRLRNRWLARAAREIVAVSQHTAAAIARDWGVPPDRVRVIPNGVSAPPPALTELERGALAAEVGLGGAGPVIGSVGRLAAEKGYDRLIRAFAGMVQGVRVQGHDGNGKGEWPQEAQKAQKGERGNIQRSAFNTQHSTEEKPLTTDFRSSAYDPGVPVSDHRSPVTGHRSPILLLIGDGPEREALERLCGELGVAPRVLFSGFRPDARRLLSLMDLFVLPSRSEGLPVSLLEAMSAGVPVCVTDAGDCRTAVDDGRCGTILPAEEMRWPEVIASLLPVDGEMPAPVLEKAKLARERVAAHYSMEATLDAYERLYADGR